MSYTLYRKVPIAADIPGELTVDKGSKKLCKKLRARLIKRSAGFWRKSDFIIVESK